MKITLLFFKILLLCLSSFSLFSMGHEWQLYRKGWQYANPYDIRNELLDHIKFLIQNKKNLSTPVKDYIRPPIIEACAYGFEDIVELLLQNGEIADRKFLGDSCLHVATFYGYIKIVKNLLSHDADLYLKNDKGLTPIDIGKQSSNGEIKDFFNQILIKLNLNKNQNI